MTSIKIALSTKALQQVPLDKYKKDFTFIVDGHEYRTSRFEADLISPIIRNRHFTDESNDQFIINTKGTFPSCKFTDFLSLLTFESQEISQKNQKFFKFLFSILGNEEGQILIESSEKVNIHNIFEIISEKQFISPNGEIEKEVKYAAEHFEELNKEEMKKLDVNIIESIIESDQLKIEDEDSLLNFIVDLYLYDRRLSFLFEKVFFSNVSNEALSNFFDAFNYNDMNGGIWHSIVDRTTNSQIKTDESLRPYTRTKLNVKELPYNYGDELNGIINYLTVKAGGNLQDHEIIKIESSSCQNEPGYNFSVKNLLNFNNLGDRSMWSPNNERNAHIFYDFFDRKVKLTDYTFHTPKDESRDYPKSWSIECSNDLINWIEVDNRLNQYVMNRKNVCKTFKCQNKSDQFYRYVKITSKGPCWSNPNRFYFDLSAVEFFGSIYEI